MNHVNKDQLVKHWPPTFRNRVLEYAEFDTDRGSVITGELVQTIAMGELLKQIEVLKEKVARLENEKS